MVTTLTGANSFALKAKLRSLMADFVAQYGDLALERIDGQEAETGQILEALTALPFLSPSKMVILTQPSTNKEFVEKFEQIINEIPETTSVVLVEPKLDKRLSYFKILKKETEFLEFTELDQAALVNFLTASAKRQGGQLSSADARYLVERVGQNQLLLANELEKLLLYNEQVSRQTIDLLTEKTPQSTIFELLEAAFGGRTKQAIDLYAEQRALKVEPQQIIAMLAWQLQVLAIVATAGDRPGDQIAKEAKLNPFVVRKSQTIARNLTAGKVKKLVADLLKIDTESKTSGIDVDEALQLYLLRLQRA